MQRSTVLALLVALVIAIPIGVVTAQVLPEEITIIEERCEITTDPNYARVQLMYRYQVEDYHYETKYEYHYGGYVNSEGDWVYGYHWGWHEVKVHDGWHDVEAEIATFYGNHKQNRWIRHERCYLIVDGVESSEFDISANRIYTKSVNGVSVYIDNSLTEAVDYPIFSPVIGVGVGGILLLIGGHFFKGPVDGYLYKRELEEIAKEKLRKQELMEREFGEGYKEY